MVRILFIMPRLGSGGAEKVVFNILNFLPSDQFESTLLLFEGEGEWVRSLPSTCRVIVCSKKRLLYSIGTLWHYIQSDYDLVFSSGYHNPLVALLGYLSSRSERILLRETAVIGVNKNRWKIMGMMKRLIPPLYSRCKSVIFQSQYGKHDFEKMFSCSLLNAYILMNPSSISRIIPASGKSIFLVGSHVPGKNFELAFNLIKQAKLSDQRVEVFGDGKLRSQLEKLAKDLAFSQIVFHGQVISMDEHWIRAGVLLLTSKSESMPNVVIEAALAGVPSVCLNSPGGLKELYASGDWGVLANTEEEFIRGLDMCLKQTTQERMELQRKAQVVFVQKNQQAYLNFLRGLK